VRQRRARLATLVDDRLRVADLPAACVVFQPIAQRRHHQAGGAVVEIGPAAEVVGRQYQDLVDTARRRLHVHGPERAHRHRILAVEGGVEIGHDADQPLPVTPVGLECRRVASSLPGQNGQGRSGSASTWERRGAKSDGRSERSATTVTHRPFSGFNQS
jgi:hypothetical protein